jgi:molybdate transport system substrate-binding protein
VARVSTRSLLALGTAAALGLGPASGQTAAPSRQVTVAAAADLKFAMDDLVQEFAKRRPDVGVRVTYGSSGNFFSQLSNGAPFDLFLSADVDYPRRLDSAGLVEPGTQRPYAIGTLVLYAPADAKLDLGRGLSVLTDMRVRRVAIANPDHAPYGRAAVTALTHERLYDAVRGKLVLGESISQAAQFVQSGNAEAGLLALSLAVAPPLRARGTYIEVPPAFYPAIEQSAVVLKNSRRKDAARAFLTFLGRPDTVQQLKHAGFREPRPAVAAAR